VRVREEPRLRRLYWSRFAPEGITVDVIPVKSATEVQDGLESGQLDFGLLAPYTPIIALERDSALITSRIVGMISRGVSAWSARRAWSRASPTCAERRSPFRRPRSRS
jgi:hypothetical protein